MSAFEKLDWAWIQSHYDQRVNTHQLLKQFYADRQTSKFAKLAVGESDPSGNYSAAEHFLGHRILENNLNAESRVFDLAGAFLNADSVLQIPPLIKKTQLSYLQIGVGSEISCMMRPSLCWVANKKSIWAHLVLKHGNTTRANEALKLYREADVMSEMAYQYWAAIHQDMGEDIARISEMQQQGSSLSKLQTTDYKFLWADAISCNLYDVYHA